MYDFSTTFKQLKQQSGLTYSEIADAIKVNQRAVQYYASGRSVPSYDKMSMLADLFNVSIDKLIGRNCGAALAEKTIIANCANDEKIVSQARKRLDKALIGLTDDQINALAVVAKQMRAG